MVRRWWQGVDAPAALVVLAIGCGSQAASAEAGGSGAGGGGSGAGGGGSGGGGGASQAATDCPSPPPAPQAGDALDGDLTIASAADAEGAAGLAEITGSLLIAPSFPGVLYLPELQRVGGDVYLEGHVVAGAPESEWASITELRLPNLESIGGELFIYLTGALVETDFRSLQTVGSRVYYMRNLALRRIGLDSITAGPVDIQASPLAASCEIDAICAQIGATGCGSQYSDPDCSCLERCERLEPSCGD
jgi:hypothetical protein